MEKGDARLLLHAASPEPKRRKIVELESHRYLHRKIRELIRKAIHSTLSTNAIRRELHYQSDRFGSHFTAQLVRSLQNEDASEREAVIWLLTVLEDPQSIPHLQRLTSNPRLPRAIRLSASLALAGLGATRETIEPPRLTRIKLSVLPNKPERALAQ